jgi:DNA end-binding protein Ku
MDASWKGSLLFGPLSIAIKLYRASTRRRAKFFTVCPSCGKRLSRPFLCRNEGKEVQQKDIRKGFQVDDGKLVIVEREELDAIRKDAEQTVRIFKFLSLEKLDPAYYGESVYLAAPEENSPVRAFQILEYAMRMKNLVAIGKIVIDGVEHVVAIRSYKKGLLMQTLRYIEEVTDIRDIKTISELRSAKFTQDEIRAMLRLVDKQTMHDFDISEFTDEYSEKVMQLVKSKARGTEFKVAKEIAHPTSKDDDLLKLLEESAA